MHSTSGQKHLHAYCKCAAFGGKQKPALLVCAITPEGFAVHPEEVRQSIPPTLLHNMFDGMKARMERVIALNGDYIGK